jgi:hypothetical protein
MYNANTGTDVLTSISFAAPNAGTALASINMVNLNAQSASTLCLGDLTFSTKALGSSTQTERMRIASGGTTTLTTNSAEFYQTGMQINSTNSDFSGALLDMRATSGSVNTANGRFLRFYSDNGSTERFHVKGSGEIYTAAGILLGGTAAANLLDNVERGTFTPTLSTSNFTNTGLTSIDCSYFKVGTMVHLQVAVSFSGTSGNWTVGDYFELASLPFTAENASGNTKYYSNSLNASTSFSTGARSTWFNLTIGTGTLTICEYANGASRGAQILGTISYSTID